MKIPVDKVSFLAEWNEFQRTESIAARRSRILALYAVKPEEPLPSEFVQGVLL